MSESTVPESTGGPETGADTMTSALPSFDNTLGAVLMGGFISVFLYGVTCLQVFIYYQRYPKDKRSIKNFVYLIWAIDSFVAALAVQACYFYLVTNYANPAAIFSPVWTLKLHVLFTSISDFIVRSLFCQRIYTLSDRNKFIVSSILCLSIVDLVIGTIITVRAFGIPTFAGLAAVAHLFYLNFATNITADTAVATILCYYLWINRTGSRRTDPLIIKLVLYTINTGLITAIVAMLGLILYAVKPDTFIFIAFYLNLSKFYVNSYLASLNVRKTLLYSMKCARDGDWVVSMHVSHYPSNEISQNMPTFRPTSATGLTVSVPGHPNAIDRRRRYGQDDTIGLDLEIGVGSQSTQSKGDVSTQVETPIDVVGSLPGKGEAGVIRADEHQYPPGILVPDDTLGEIDPESCYEAPQPKLRKDVSVQAQYSEKDRVVVEKEEKERREKDSDPETGSDP